MSSKIVPLYLSDGKRSLFVVKDLPNLTFDRDLINKQFLILHNVSKCMMNIRLFSSAVLFF